MYEFKNLSKSAFKFNAVQGNHKLLKTSVCIGQNITQRLGSAKKNIETCKPY